MKQYRGLNPDPRAWVYHAMKGIDSAETGFPALDDVIHTLYDDLRLLPCGIDSVRKYQEFDYFTAPELNLRASLDPPFSAIFDRLDWDATYQDYSAQPEWPIVIEVASQVAKKWNRLRFRN